MSVSRLATSLALFALLAIIANLPMSMQVDRAITLWLQRAAPAADATAAVLALLGDPEVIIPGLTVAGLVLLILGDKHYGRALLWLAVGVVGVSVLSVVLQDVIAHPLPPLALTRYIARRGLTLRDPKVVISGFILIGLSIVFLPDRFRGHALVWSAAGIVGIILVALIPKYVTVHFGQQILRAAGLNPAGIPSAHTMRTTLLAGTMLRRVPVLAGAIVVSMMASLVYLGVHWTSEVLAGFCLGWACVEVAREVWQRLG
jgi:membrane-associated phospholipid phosphatase